MPQTILVVDDDAEQRRILKLVLGRDGFQVELADRGKGAFDSAVKLKPDLIISDVVMPLGDGIELCRRLKSDKRTSAIPIVLMSGQHKDADYQAEGIELGADDYLVKPFTPRLLSAKVAAVLRRFAAPEELHEVLRNHGLVLDVSARTVTLKGRQIELTRKEFDLLTTFLQKPNRVLNANYLLEAVWGYDPADYNDPATVQVHLSTLRKKLGEPFAERIVSVPGVGYRFDP